MYHLKASDLLGRTQDNNRHTSQQQKKKPPLPINTTHITLLCRGTILSSVSPRGTCSFGEKYPKNSIPRLGERGPQDHFQKNQKWTESRLVKACRGWERRRPTLLPNNNKETWHSLSQVIPNSFIWMEPEFQRGGEEATWRRQQQRLSTKYAATLNLRPRLPTAFKA